MTENDMPSSGVSDEMLTSGVSDEDDQDLDLDEDEDLVDEDEDEESEDEEQDNQKKVVDRKQRYHQTNTAKKREVATLRRELAELKNAKKASFDEADLAKIREKYDEEDLEIIEKIIEKKANALIDNRQMSTLAQKEMNIFLKEHPDLSDPEIKHIKHYQKEFGYSLKRAYEVLFGKNADGQSKPVKHNVSNSFS